MPRALVVTILLLFGCSSPPPTSGPEPERPRPPLSGPELEYPLVIVEKTGLTVGLFLPGVAREPGRYGEYGPSVMIRFTDDSDRDAVESFAALDYKVLRPNSPAEREGEGIVFVGVLDPEVQHTPDGPEPRATSEPYQEFRLSRWYLRSPFTRMLWVQTPESDPPELVQDDKLRPEDFRGRVSGDLSRFLRPR